MDDFRHNLSPVEVKTFLQTIARLTDDFLIRYCRKISKPCPKCAHPELCYSVAVSLFTSQLDKMTHEIIACLKCRYHEVSVMLTMEKM